MRNSQGRKNDEDCIIDEQTFDTPYYVSFLLLDDNKHFLCHDFCRLT